MMTTTTTTMMTTTTKPSNGSTNNNNNNSSGTTQYPAVLAKGSGRTTSAASPPNPNLVPSGKVPPPVPPRGSISARGSKTDSSGRGDDAEANNNNNNNNHTGQCLHATARSLPTLHVETTITTNTTTRKPTPRLIRQPPPRPALPLLLPPAIIPEETTTRTHRRNTEYVQYGQLRPRNLLYAEEEDDDEFVSVEMIDDSYVIKTSPYPFRPERGRRCRSTSGGIDELASLSDFSRFSTSRPGSACQLTGHTPPINMPKFTYFINPAGNPELMNWKMSRKDKKHTETYTERMQRIEMEKNRSAILTSSSSTPLPPPPPPPRMVFEDSSSRIYNAMNESKTGHSRKIQNKSKSGNKLSNRIHVRYPKRKKLAPLPALRRQLAEKVSWLRISSQGLTNHQKATSTSALSSSHGSSAYQSTESNIKFLGQAYPEWFKSQSKLFKNLEGNGPNVRRSSSKEHPETLKKYLSDEQYRDYLDEQSAGQKKSALQRNSSFLHGYTSSK